MMNKQAKIMDKKCHLILFKSETKPMLLEQNTFILSHDQSVDSNVYL